VEEFETVRAVARGGCGGATFGGGGDSGEGGTTPEITVAPRRCDLASFRIGTVNQALDAVAAHERAAGMLGVHRSTLYRWLAEQRLVQA